MRRVPEVIDCWYDSGAMPFAQWGYRGQSSGESCQRFLDQFPADFISEALDQTRGWFYSLLAISTLLFHDSSESSDGPELTVPYPHPFRNCIVLGLMLSEWYEDKQGTIFLTEEEARQAAGKQYRQIVGKMSKSKRNYQEPQQIFERYGADALRWYFFANQAPWTSIRYSERAIKDSIPEFMLRLWNVYDFLRSTRKLMASILPSTRPGVIRSRPMLQRTWSRHPLRRLPRFDPWQNAPNWTGGC